MVTKSTRPASISILKCFFFLLCIASCLRMSSQFNYYYGNIHSQTSYSDGNKDSSTSGITTPLQAFTYANASQHIDFYGVSDHNHLNAGMSSPAHFHMGLADANAANADGSFVAMYGQEWGVISGGGHVIVYGYDSLMGWDTNDYDVYVAQNNYTTLWTKINAKPGAFGYLAHPQQTDYTNLFTAAYSTSADNAIVGMAARSGPAFSTNTTYSNPSTSNYIARYNEALSQGYHLGVGLDHDTHNSVFGRQTAGRLVLLAGGLTRYDMLDAIRKMRMYSSDDWNVQVDFNISNQPMGSTYAHAGAPTINVSVTDPDVEAVSSIKIYSGVPGSGTLPTVLTSNTGTASLVYTHSAATSGSVHYYYAEITQSDGDVIWTAPIWYTVNSAITANPPVTSFTLPASACVGQAIPLTDLSTNSPDTWQWTMVGATTNSAVTQNPAVTYTAAGTYSITLIASNGTGTGIPYTKTVTVGGSSPTLTISGNSSVCSGSAVSLTGAGATSYTWSTGAVSGSISVSPTTTTVYTLTGSNGGCAGTATKTITIGTSPTVGISGTGAICPGSSVSLTGSGATSYTWSTGATSGSISVSPTTTTVYTLTGSNGGCNGTATKTISVSPAPALSISGPSSICTGNITNLVGNGATSYTWSTGATTNSVLVSPSTTTVYTLTGSNGGCTSTTTRTVTVSSTPTVSISGSGVICAGSPVTITSSGASTYTWSTAANTTSISVSPSVTTTYSVIGANGGCSGTASKVITVNALPAVAISGQNTICSGASDNLSGSGANTFTWSTSATTSSISVAPPSTTSYSVTGTDANGCKNSAVKTVTVNQTPVISASGGGICPGNSFTLSPSGAATYTYSGGSAVVSPASTQSYTISGTSSSGCSASPIVVTVTVSPSLSVSITGPNAVCAGGTLTLTANGAYTYTWNTGATGNSVSVIPSASTSYSVNGNGGSGCSGSGTKAVTVNSLPVVTASSSNTMLCSGQAVTLTAGGAGTYTWSTSQTGSSISVSPAGTTTYSVAGTDSNGCSGTASVTQTVSICTGIASAQLLTNYSVYPNPNNGSFTIETGAASRIILYDMLGNTLLVKNIEQGTYAVDISGQANGLYYLKVLSGNQQAVVKVMKQ